MINYNGKYFENGSAIIGSSDHSYRYGDGLFETLKIVDGIILYKDDHFERLFSGLKILKFAVPGLFKETVEVQIRELCKRNGHESSARVRLSVSRGAGGLFDVDNKFSYLIETWPGETNGFNENTRPPGGPGLRVDIFPDARKSMDIFSNLKSANYQPYVMAAVWAKENNLDEALILNSSGRICDATIANVFWVKEGVLFTTPLAEGGVAGVMRKNILSWTIQNRDFIVKESIFTEDELLMAEEVFLTNVISGIRWVRQCREKSYSYKVSSKIISEFK